MANSFNTEIDRLRSAFANDCSSPNICVAVLDGLVDLTHPCFKGANLTYVDTLVAQKTGASGSMSAHGTHVASTLFGQLDSPVEGLVPNCKGLIVPIFSDEKLQVSQLDLARAIEQAVRAGAHIINISGGQLTDFGEAEGWLENAISLCQEKNVLVVSAVGNEGCDCLHVPAAPPTVLAVGATNNKGSPSDFSNWGRAYQVQGLLAPGEEILGAKPGGGTIRLSGTSFATPMVSGCAALLLSLQVARGDPPDPHRIGKVLLESALPCDEGVPEMAQKCLAGKLNISGALNLLEGENMTKETALAAGVEAAGCGCTPGAAVIEDRPENIETREVEESMPGSMATAGVRGSKQGRMDFNSGRQPVERVKAAVVSSDRLVTASQAPSELETAGDLVYALGVLGYDFGAEARRDSFKQLMPATTVGGTVVPANPYDARQMVDYLGNNLSEARSLIWTLNIELTPVYAIEPKGPFSDGIYERLLVMLAGQIEPADSDDFIERVSLPARRTNRTVELLSGQIVPVVTVRDIRGMYGWKVNTLVSAAIANYETAEIEEIQQSLTSFLNRVYYDLRNVGQTSRDRTLNFAATNTFQAAATFAEAIANRCELDSIEVEKSPYRRLNDAVANRSHKTKYFLVWMLASR